MTEDAIEPWLGTMGQGRPLFGALMTRSLHLGWNKAGMRSRPVKGWFMRGAGVAAVLRHGQSPQLRQRKVQVGHRILRLGGAARQNIARHLDYLSQPGKGRTGESPELYSDVASNEQRHVFSNLTQDHRHQFRIVLEPENGWEYPNLRPLVGRLMKQVALDLRVDLDWVAADHFDTGRPHSHIVVAGRDRSGENILIAPTYLKDGIAARAAELVSLDLGPDAGSKVDREQSLTAEKAIDLDLELLGRADPKGLVVPHDPDGHHQGLLTRRLITLASLGLATREAHGAWQLREDMLVQLATIERRNRDWSFVQGVGAAQHPDRPRSDYAVWDPRRDEPVAGRILAVEDLANGERSIIIDTIMGELMRAQGRSDVELRPEMVVHVGGGDASSDGEVTGQGAAFAVLSRESIEKQIQLPGRTWLDQIATQDPPIRLGHGFGKEVRHALVERDSWLRQHALQRDARDFSGEM
jgi:Protein of unknown function (DUF3363)